jgi:hypothetical protein
VPNLLPCVDGSYGHLLLCCRYWAERWITARLVWDATNVRPLERDHPERGIARAEVSEVLNDPQRLETAEIRRQVSYHTVIGSTATGRLLVVVSIDHAAGRFPFTPGRPDA